MTDITRRKIFRWTHIVFSIPVVGYIYTPFEALPEFAHLARYGFLPILVLSGLWMWKGHVLRQLVMNATRKETLNTLR